LSVTLRSLSTPRKDTVPIVQEAGWAPGPVWTGTENFAHTGTRSPDRPARSQSLYRLSHPAHVHKCKYLTFTFVYTRQPLACRSLHVTSIYILFGWPKYQPVLVMHVLNALGLTNSIGIEFPPLLLESLRRVLGHSDSHCLSSVCLLPDIIVDVTRTSGWRIHQSTGCAVSHHCVVSVEVGAWLSKLASVKYLNFDVRRRILTPKPFCSAYKLFLKYFAPCIAI
jgi:hypothetical protein